MALYELKSSMWPCGVCVCNIYTYGSFSIVSPAKRAISGVAYESYAGFIGHFCNTCYTIFVLYKSIEVFPCEAGSKLSL